jgi:hypothetical protein
MNLIRHLSNPHSTTTLTNEQWQEYLKNNDPTTFIQGHLFNVNVRSIGGGMLQAYLTKF